MSSRGKKKRTAMAPHSFQVGHQYQHESGVYCCVLAEVLTRRWGPALVFEQIHENHHAMSVANKQALPKDIGAFGWVEIGKPEWLEASDRAACDGCDVIFTKGEQYVLADEGVFHRPCYEKVIGGDAIDQVGAKIVKA